jgi:hypothetical protein
MPRRLFPFLCGQIDGDALGELPFPDSERNPPGAHLLDKGMETCDTPQHGLDVLDAVESVCRPRPGGHGMEYQVWGLIVLGSGASPAPFAAG